MSSQPKPTSTDALRSLAKFAFDAEEQLDDASIAQIDEVLRKQGTDPEALVNRMKQFLGQQESELLAAEMEERRATILASATTFSFPSLSVMRQAVVNYGFAARLDDEMTEEDIRALYQQVQILQGISEGVGE